MDSKIEDRVMGGLFFVVVASALAVLVTGCGEAAPGEADEDVGGIDIDAPADSTAQGRIVLSGAIALGELRGDAARERGNGRGFTIDLRRGDELTVEVGATQAGRFRMYGPKLASGKWGVAQTNKKVFKSGEGRGYAVWGSFDVEVPADGHYAFVFVALRDGTTLFDFRITKKAVGGCHLGGHPLSVGESAPLGDGCNTCTCRAGGFVACTERLCPSASCMLNGRRLAVGERAPMGDGCNHCSCNEGGTLYCTQLACAPRAGCDFGGRRLSVGESAPAGDGCNSCTCRDGGSVACTELACGPRTTCNFGGERHNVGESFPAGDGCNSCTCREGGSVSCTERLCNP